MSGFQNASIKDLVAFILTGFPLAKQKAALLELAKRMGTNQNDLIRLSCAVVGKDKDYAMQVLSEHAKKKNAPIKEITEYLSEGGR